MNDKKLTGKDITRETKINKEFVEFFNDFKEKNKDKWASIVNGMDIDVDKFAEETFQELEDKYKVMNEVHKRKQLAKGFDEFEEISKEKLKTEIKYNDRLIKPYYKGFGQYHRETEKTDDLDIALSPDVELGEQYDTRKFHMIFLDTDMICNVTTLNRIMHRRVLIYAGNKEGLVAYGCGIGLDYQSAWMNAFTELKKNLLLIEWDPTNTVPRPIKTRFNDYRWRITPSKSPKWFSGPIPLLLMRYAGFYHQEFKKKSRNKEPYAMVFAYFKAITQNVTPRMIAESRGVKKNHYNHEKRRLMHKIIKNPQLKGKI